MTFRREEKKKDILFLFETVQTVTAPKMKKARFLTFHICDVQLRKHCPFSLRMRLQSIWAREEYYRSCPLKDWERANYSLVCQWGYIENEVHFQTLLENFPRRIKRLFRFYMGETVQSYSCLYQQDFRRECSYHLATALCPQDHEEYLLELCREKDARMRKMRSYMLRMQQRHTRLRLRYRNEQEQLASALLLAKNYIETLKKSKASSCCVCLTQPPTYVTIPCGHMCLCQSCSEHLFTRKDLRMGDYTTSFTVELPITHPIGQRMQQLWKRSQEEDRVEAFLLEYPSFEDHETFIRMQEPWKRFFPTRWLCPLCRTPLDDLMRCYM